MVHHAINFLVLDFDSQFDCMVKCTQTGSDKDLLLPLRTYVNISPPGVDFINLP